MKKINFFQRDNIMSMNDLGRRCGLTVGGGIGLYGVFVWGQSFWFMVLILISIPQYYVQSFVKFLYKEIMFYLFHGASWLILLVSIYFKSGIILFFFVVSLFFSFAFDMYKLNKVDE